MTIEAQASSSGREFWRALRVQQRVISAIMMRQFIVRWGRRDLGFAWLFAEPLVFAFPVLAMWSFIRPEQEHGLPLIPFLWTGYLPILLFRHVTGNALYAIRSNAAFLYHRCITPLDLFIGTCGLEALGNVAACASSFLLMYWAGFLPMPVDFPMFLVGFFYMTWWSLAVALVIAALSERSELVQHIWSPISYMYLMVSGFFFMAAWLPLPLQKVALAIDPPLHAYEIIRSGMFGNAIETHYDIPYLTYILATMTLIGLWFLKDVRDHLEFE